MEGRPAHDLHEQYCYRVDTTGHSGATGIYYLVSIYHGTHSDAARYSHTASDWIRARGAHNEALDVLQSISRLRAIRRCCLRFDNVVRKRGIVFRKLGFFRLLL